VRLPVSRGRIKSAFVAIRAAIVWAATLPVRTFDWLECRYPLIHQTLQRIHEADVVDRAAALALFCIFAAVPMLFAALSVVGFLLTAVDTASGFTGVDLAVRGRSIARLHGWLQSALPGVTWNPTEFADALVRDRKQNGIVGTVLAISLSLAVFSRIDAAVRAVFRRPERSALRAAGMMSGLVLLGALVAMLTTFLAPLSEWGLRVAARGMTTLSLGWVDGLALAVTATQVLPVAVVFYAIVRWSAGSVGKRKLAVVALSFGALWFIGQRLFSLYVENVVHMDAVYGALTGVVALMLWLFYANIAFLVAVAVLAAWASRKD
jgi:uncharacterized BrkB/YihY/UPF0761 family membrane protein